MRHLSILMGGLGILACQPEPEVSNRPDPPHPDCALDEADACVCGIDNVVIDDWATAFAAVERGEDCRSIIECDTGGEAVRKLSTYSNLYGSEDYFNADGEPIAGLEYTDVGSYNTCIEPLRHWYGQTVQNCPNTNVSFVWPTCATDVLERVVWTVSDESADVGFLTDATTLDEAQAFEATACFAKTTCTLSDQPAVIWLRTTEIFGVSPREFLERLDVDAFNAETGQLMATAHIYERHGELPVSCLAGPYTASSGCALDGSAQ